MSPSGYYSAGEHATNWSIKVYAGYSTVTNGFARLHMILRPVINLKSNIQISSGDGTKNNPFIVE